MVSVVIRGKEFPLCLTVAALDKINDKCGGLKQLGQFMDGKDPQYIICPGDEDDHDATADADLSKVVSNTAWLLGLLIQEGEENRLAISHFDGEPAERCTVPDVEVLSHLLTIASVRKYRTAVFQAINESMKQEIEAVYSKNVKSEERG